MASPSIAEYRGGREGYRCGYCGQTGGKASHGMWAHTLTVQDYQDLIDRGWRRSGKYTYKPTMNQTCCPQYAIRCNIQNFKIKKSHKKVIKRVNRFLNTGVKPGACTHEDDDHQRSPRHTDEAAGFEPREIVPERVGKTFDDMKVSGSKTKKTPPAKEVNCKGESSGTSSKAAVASAKSDCDKQSDATGKSKSKGCDAGGGGGEKTAPKPGVGADPSRPPCKKAKLRRLEKRQQKQSHKEGVSETQAVQNKEKRATTEQKSLESLLSDISENPVHKLELRLVRSQPRSDCFSDTFQEAHQVYKRYQMAIHGDAPDKPDEKQYTRFLVNSPLEEESSKREGGFPDGFGSFHQQYVLDGKIIAVGVLDILPHAVSSVYLFYDPDYAFLSLGTYSALREIAFTRHVNTMEPDLKYYYMGYYIHSCPKMRYKGQYHGSNLLCPETYLWYPIDHCSQLLDANKYSRFAEPDKVDANGDVELNSVMILCQRQAMPYFIYSALNTDAEDRAEVEEYASFVGKTVSSRMLLYRTASSS